MSEAKSSSSPPASAMRFVPKPGCPMCSIVSTALHAPSNSPRNPSFPTWSKQPEVLWRDDHFTVYREKAHPVSPKGHIIIAFNLHVPSIYNLSSADLPLLVNIRNLAYRLLPTLSPSPNPALGSSSAPMPKDESQFRVGFITPPFKDSKIPVTDHLHAHAYILPANNLGWWRGIAYGSMAWYAIDDLIAEIRESCSNNRVKSGYENRPRAPIDMVPAAGARTGTADGVEFSEPGLASPDLEGGNVTSPPPLSAQSTTLRSSSPCPPPRI